MGRCIDDPSWRSAAREEKVGLNANPDFSEFPEDPSSYRTQRTYTF